MIIRRIHIASFGPLTDFDCELYSGMNVIRGDNESGKSSLAMFIKFMLYGLSGRSVDGIPSERRRFVNWRTGCAEGYIIVEDGERSYRIERGLSVTVKAGSDKETARETLTVTDTATGGRVREMEDCPGMAIFGVPEQVFVNTVFSGQNGRGRIDGADTAAAVENLLFSADETVSVKKAAERLDKLRRTLMHKKGSGGEIPALGEECRSLRAQFEEAGILNTEIIELESAIATHKAADKKICEEIEAAERALEAYNASCLVKEGAEAQGATEAAEAAETALRSALHLCCDAAKVEEARGILASLESERNNCDELRNRITDLESGAASLAASNFDEEPEDGLKRYRKHKGSLTAGTAIGIGGMIFALVAGALSAVFYASKNNTVFLLLLAVAAVFAVLGGVFFILRGKTAAKMRDICESFEVSDEGELQGLVDYIKARREESEKVYSRAEAARMNLDEAVARLDSLEAEAVTIAVSFEDCAEGERLTDATPAERLSAAVNLANMRRGEAEAKRNAFETAAAMAEMKWAKISREKLLMAEEYLRGFSGEILTEDGAKNMETGLSFNRAKLGALRDKCHAAEVELASKRAVALSPAKLWEELCDANERLHTLTLRHDAVNLASETLAVAGENMRRGIIPRIVKNASRMFGDATEGRYESLGAGSAFALSAVENGHTRDISLLSAGTEDLAYVCLRVALAAELFGEKKPPLIFDETLAYMDPGRRDGAKDILAASGHQVLLFTCRPEDAADHTLKLTRE